jgi:radical SAM protein with 4Fe4S-binding SPASM domain
MVSADIKLGYSCNNNCIHCVIASQRDDCQKQNRGIDRSTREYIKSLYDARISGASRVIFTGGEPLIRKDLLSLLDYARRLGFQISLQTNGRMLYYENFVEKLKPFQIIFVIALHGHIPEIHDQITRAKNSFKQTTKGIDNLIKHEQIVQGKVVISKKNYRYLKELTEYLIKKGVKKINIAFPHPQGNAYKYFSDVVPTYTDVKKHVLETIEFVEKENKTKKEHIHISFEAIPYCFMDEKHEFVSEFKKIGQQFKLLDQLGSEKLNWARVRKEIKTKFAQCKECKYDNICEGVWEEYPEKCGSSEFWPVPLAPKSISEFCENIVKPELEVKLEITGKCNFKCEFCQNKTSFLKHPDAGTDLDYEGWERIIDNVAEAGVKKVRITGGEPTTRSDMYQLIDHASKKNLNVTLNTNAYLLTEENINLIKDKLDYVLIPIHSLDDGEEFVISGVEKAFTKKTDIIKYIKNNTNITVGCNTLINRKNIDKIEIFCDLMRTLCVDEWFLSFPVPTGNKMDITNDGVKEIVEKLLEYNKKHNKRYNIGKCAAIPFCAYSPRKLLELSQFTKVGAINCGPYNEIVIDPKGNIKPCYSLNHDLGNALKTDFKSILEHPLIKRFKQKEFVPEVCKSCKLVEICMGGCRYIPQAVSDNIRALHPLAQPEKYKDVLFE